MSPEGMEMVPEVGCCKPASSFNKVLLPAPFFPTSAILSLGLMRNDIPENKGFELNSTVSCSIDIMLGNCQLVFAFVISLLWKIFSFFSFDQQPDNPSVKSTINKNDGCEIAVGQIAQAPADGNAAHCEAKEHAGNLYVRESDAQQQVVQMVFVGCERRLVFSDSCRHDPHGVEKRDGQ